MWTPPVGRFLEEEESLDELSGVQVSALIFVLVTIIILLSVGFELLKEALTESIDEELEPVVKALFSELTTLGALSLLSYVLVESTLFTIISEALFGISVIDEVFELIHMGVFAVAVIFMIQVAMFLQLGMRLGKHWQDLNDVVQEPKDMMKYEACLLNPKGAKREDLKKAKEVYEFYSLRQEFIVERQLSFPFAEKDLKDQLRKDFAYGHYLTESYAAIMAEVVEVPYNSWATLWLLLVAFFFVMVAAQAETKILMFVWLPLGFALLLGLLILDWKVSDITHHMHNPALIPAPERPTSEQTRVSFVTYSRPKWTGLPEPNKKTASSVHHLFKAVPKNRQEAIYTFGSKGDEFNVFVLRLMLFLNAIYMSVIFIVFIEFAFEIFSLGGAVAYTVVSLLPSFLILGFAVNTIGKVVHINSIGAFRNEDRVRDVVRTQKTTRVLSTLLLVSRLRMSMELHGGHLSMDDGQRLGQLAKEAIGDPATLISEDQVEDIGRTFDAFDKDGTGTVEDTEVQALLKSIGMNVANSELRNVVAMLDLDNSGTIDRNEFIWWYAKEMTKNPQPAKEMLEELFDLIDKDKSGKITLQEMVEAISAIDGGLTLNEISDLFREVDTDQSGVIEKEEFIEVMEENLESDVLGTH